MSRRPLSSRVLWAAATLAAVPVGAAPRAQAVDLQGGDLQGGDLRGGDNAVGGFPTSPADAPLTSPEDTRPPSTGVSPGAASGQQAPDDQSTSPAAEDTPDPGAPNYGKPRKRKPNLYTFNHKPLRPLSPLAPYRGAPGTRRRTLDPMPPTATGDLPQPGPTVAAIPTLPLPKRPAVPEADPYAPTGVKVGELILKPFVEGSTGYETNPNQVSAGVKRSAVLRADGGLDVVSDFSSSSLTAALRGGYSDFPSNHDANRPDLSAVVDGRVDVTRQDTIDTEARFSLATQTPGSPLLAVPNAVFITNRPTITSEGTTLGGTHLFGPLSVGLKGTFDRTQYGDATQSDGSLYRYSEDNYNDYGVVARVGYELTPGLVPFTELGYDSRVRDNAIDLSGYARDSIGGTARAGASFDVLGHFTGSASAGYLERHYSDRRLPNLRGPTLDGRLAYAVTPLTTLTLSASTTASETTLVGASGAISRNFSAELAHTFFHNFTVSGIATYQPNQYQGVSGSEKSTTLTLKGAYSLNRDMQLIASASHQTLKSTFPGEGFTDDVFLAGVRLQR